MQKFTFAIAALLLILAGCDKDYLNRAPQIQLTTSSALVTNENFQTYTWKLYDYVSGYGDRPDYLLSQDCNSDNMIQAVIGQQSPYMNHTKIVPNTGSATQYLVVSGWDFSYVRGVNVMLDAIDNSQMSQTQKDHWRSVGYFFRALRYYDLLAAFGSVPWIAHTLNEDSASALNGPRTPRDIVAKNILDDLQWADAHIGAGNPDGKNTINQACIDALISRFGLFEGTWRKYHGLNNAAPYLEACKTYSKKLMDAYPDGMPNYNAIYNSQTLADQPGIILYKQYAPNLTDHAWGPKAIGNVGGTTDEVTRDAVDAYLCADGRPISTSKVYDGDSTMYDEFRSRDHRLYLTVEPPYKVNIGTPNNTWSYTADPRDAEYIHLLDSLMSGYPLTLQLPFCVWSTSMQDNALTSRCPAFAAYNPASDATGLTRLGYLFWKQWNRFPLDGNNNSTTAYPVFRIGEVWLNYAECMFELGMFSQQTAEETINKLRPRAGLPSMNVSEIVADFDLNRDPTVAPVLWEIRRERRIELMGDGFRFNDLKRWKKGGYMDKMQLGLYVRNEEYGNKLNIYEGGDKGHLQFFPKPQGWLDKYYLEPVPSQELLLNKSLEQNTGW